MPLTRYRDSILQRMGWRSVDRPDTKHGRLTGTKATGNPLTSAISRGNR